MSQVSMSPSLRGGAVSSSLVESPSEKIEPDRRLDQLGELRRSEIGIEGQGSRDVSPLTEISVGSGGRQPEISAGKTQLHKPSHWMKAILKFIPRTLLYVGTLGGAFALSRFMRGAVFGSTEDRRGLGPSKRDDSKTAIQFAQERISVLQNAKTCSVTSSSGKEMRGNFYSPASSGSGGEPDLNKKIVLLLTGSGGSAQEQGLDLARMYSEQKDLNVLSVNYRSFGDSDAAGLPDRNGLYQDGHDMFNHLVKMGFKPENIVIHGYSLGGAVAAKLHQTAEKQNIRLGGVFYDRPMTSVWSAAKSHEGSSLAGFLGRWGAGRMSVEAKLKDVSAESRTPVLFSYDQEELGAAGKKLGESIQTSHGNITCGLIETGAEHLDNVATARRYADDKRLDQLLRGGAVDGDPGGDVRDPDIWVRNSNRSSDVRGQEQIEVVDVNEVNLAPQGTSKLPTEFRLASVSTDGTAGKPTTGEPKEMLKRLKATEAGGTYEFRCNVLQDFNSDGKSNILTDIENDLKRSIDEVQGEKWQFDKDTNRCVREFHVEIGENDFQKVQSPNSRALRGNKLPELEQSVREHTPFSNWDSVQNTIQTFLYQKGAAMLFKYLKPAVDVSNLQKVDQGGNLAFYTDIHKDGTVVVRNEASNFVEGYDDGASGQYVSLERSKSRLNMSYEIEFRFSGGAGENPGSVDVKVKSVQVDGHLVRV